MPAEAVLLLDGCSAHCRRRRSPLVYQAAARERDYRALLARGDAAARATSRRSAPSRPTAARSPCAPTRCWPTCGAARPTSGAASSRRPRATSARPPTLDPTATRPLEELGDVLYQRSGSTARPRRTTRPEARRPLGRASATSWRWRSYRDRRPRRARWRRSRQTLDARRPAGRRALPARPVPARPGSGPPRRSTRFERAVALAPGLIPAREELADLYGSLGRRTDELEQLQVIAGLDREHVERQVAVGLAQARAGHAELAVSRSAARSSARPDQPLVYRALGRSGSIARRRSDDRVDLSKALEALDASRRAPTRRASADAVRPRAAARRPDSKPPSTRSSRRPTRYPDRSAVAASATHGRRAAEPSRRRAPGADRLRRAGRRRRRRRGRGPRASRALSLRLNDPPRPPVRGSARAADASPNDVARSLDGRWPTPQLKAGDTRRRAQATIARGLEKDPARTLDAARRSAPPRHGRIVPCDQLLASMRVTGGLLRIGRDRAGRRRGN